MLEFSPMNPDQYAGSGANANTGFIWPAYFWILFGANGFLTLCFVIEVCSICICVYI